MKKYSLNSDFVLRFDEQIVFDSDRFIVHKFNSAGIDILKAFEEKALTFNEIQNIFPEISEVEIQEFIDKSMQANIICVGSE